MKIAVDDFCSAFAANSFCVNCFVRGTFLICAQEEEKKNENISSTESTTTTIIHDFRGNIRLSICLTSRNGSQSSLFTSSWMGSMTGEKGGGYILPFSELRAKAIFGWSVGWLIGWFDVLSILPHRETITEPKNNKSCTK